MKVEAEALLRLARGEGLGAAGAVSNWEALQRLAAQHQVDTLLHEQIRLGSPAGETLADAPTSVRERLRAAWLHEGLRNEHLANGLREVAATLAAEKVEFVVFKGPWLAFEAYPSPNCRSIEDIDLGIREDDYLPALRALGQLGYSPIDPLPRTGKDAIRRAHYSSQIRLTAPARRPLELHFRLVNMGPPRDEESWLWNSRRELDLGGATIHVPGHEAMLLHLLLHANQHGFRSLRLLYDIRFALERFGDELDVGLVRELIHERKCETSAWFSLQLSKSMTGVQCGQELSDSIRPTWFGRKRFEALWSLDRVRGLDAPIRSTSVEAPRLYMLELDGILDRLSYALRVSYLRVCGRP